MYKLASNGRFLALILLTITSLSLSSTVQAKQWYQNLEIDSEQLLSWCEMREFRGQIKEKTRRKLRNWRWKFCEELLRNKEPIAVIEGPETAGVNSYFILDASGSTDPDGEVLSYSWRQLSGTPAINVNGLDNAGPSFYVATGTAAGEDLLFELSVSDGELISTETFNVSVPTCDEDAGLIFADCFTPSWNGYTAWEFIMDGSGASYQVLNGHNENFIKWQSVDTGDPEHNQVIDIKYADQSGFNALPRVRPAGGLWSAIDMSVYAGGTIQFDVRVLDWAGNTSGLEFKVECFQPCESAYIPLAIDEINEWQHIIVSVDELVEGGADLSKLDIGFQINPVWDQQAGVHFQLDNMRWSHEPPPEPPAFETFAPTAANWVYRSSEYQLNNWTAEGNSLSFQLTDYPSAAIVGFSHTFGSPINLVGGALTGDIRIPVQSETMSFLVIPWFFDDNFRYASADSTWVDLASSEVSYDISVSDLRLETMSFADEGFSLDKVSSYGYYIIIFGDLVETTDDFILENLSITKSNLPVETDPGAGSQEISLDYANWNVVDYSGSTTLSSSSDQTSLSFSAEWLDGSELFGVNYQFIPPVNLDGGSFSFDLFVPEIAKQTTGAIGIYFYDANWNQAAQTWIPLADLNGDAWNNFSFDPFSTTANFNFMDAGFNFAEVGYVDILFLPAGSIVDEPLNFVLSNVQMFAGDGTGNGGGGGAGNGGSEAPSYLRTLPVTEGWRVSNDTSNLTYSSAGVSFSPNSSYDQLVFDITSPENYQGKTFTFEIVADQAFIDSGSDIQPFAQIKAAEWPGHWTCWISNNDLSTSGEIYTCTLDTAGSNGDPLFDLTIDGVEMQVGIQVTGVPAGTITIVSWGVDLPPISDIPLSSGWSATDGLVVNYSESGVSYSPTANDQQLTYEISGPNSLEGATFYFDISVSQEFLDSGASLQPFALQLFDTFTGEWNCWINNSELTTTLSRYSCILDETGAPFNLADQTQSLQVGLQAKGSPSGSVTIHRVDIVHPQISVDSGWRTTGGSAISYGGGVTVIPTTGFEQLIVNVAGPINLSGATFVMTIAASQEYIDSGSNLQPFALQLFGDYFGHWTCWVGNAELTTTGTEYACTFDVLESWNLAEGEEIQLGVQTSGDFPAGSVTVSKVGIIYAD